MNCTDPNTCVIGPFCLSRKFQCVHINYSQNNINTPFPGRSNETSECIEAGVSETDVC